MVAENLLEAMRFFGRARDNAEVRDLPGVCVISCGLNYAAFNAAVLTAPAGVESNELAGRLQVSASEFEAKGLRWTYWMCEDYLARSAQREFRAILQRFGLQPLTDAPGMFAERLLPPRRPLPDVDVRAVSDARTRNAFAWITSVAFDIPLTVCSAVYGAERAWTGSFHGHVGYFEGAPVCTAATVFAADAVGVYSVATLPSHRKLGCGEAVTRRALLAAHQKFGVERTVLQATRSGYALYEQMGYRSATRFTVHIAG